MNKLILAFVVCFGLTACGNNDAKKNDTVKVEQTQSQEVNNRVEILYFHGKQRCATCMALAFVYPGKHLFNFHFKQYFYCIYNFRMAFSFQ